MLLGRLSVIHLYSSIPSALESTVAFLSFNEYDCFVQRHAAACTTIIHIKYAERQLATSIPLIFLASTTSISEVIL